MSAVNINLQGQLILFLENNRILIPIENDKVYLWQHNGVEHKLAKAHITSVVESIATRLIREGTEDLTDFQKGVGMPPEDVVSLVQGLVRQELKGRWGWSE